MKTVLIIALLLSGFAAFGGEYKSTLLKCTQVDRQKNQFSLTVQYPFPKLSDRHIRLVYEEETFSPAAVDVVRDEIYFRPSDRTKTSIEIIVPKSFLREGGKGRVRIRRALDNAPTSYICQSLLAQG